MFLRLLKYPYANSRARVLATGILDPSKLQELAGLNDRKAALSALGAERSIPVGEECEERLTGREFLSYGFRLAVSLPGASRRLIIAYLKRIDLLNLKTVCRGLLGNRPPESWRRLLVDSEPVGELPPALLSQADSLEKLEELLHRHPLRRISGLLRRTKEEERLLRLDMALEQFFWESLEEPLSGLSRFDRSAAREILGIRADVERFSLVSRGWKAGLSPQDILAGLPPFGDMPAANRIEKILHSDKTEERLRRLWPPPGAEDPWSAEGEAALMQGFYRKLRKILRSHPFDISVPLASLLLKEMEVRDLKVVLGGLRFNRSREEMQTLLACARR